MRAIYEQLLLVFVVLTKTKALVAIHHASSDILTSFTVQKMLLGACRICQTLWWMLGVTCAKVVWPFTLCTAKQFTALSAAPLSSLVSRAGLCSILFSSHCFVAVVCKLAALKARFIMPRFILLTFIFLYPLTHKSLDIER